jgi:hypothetical protein
MSTMEPSNSRAQLRRGSVSSSFAHFAAAPPPPPPLALVPYRSIHAQRLAPKPETVSKQIDEVF